LPSAVTASLLTDFGLQAGSAASARASIGTIVFGIV
jgi:hypothetical protein